MSTITNLQLDNLFKAYGLFIEAYRPYIVSILQAEAGDRWPAWYVDALYQNQRDQWNEGIRTGSSPETLIDYPHLKSVALKYKDLLREDFGKKTNNLVSWFQTLYDIRNKLAHFSEITDDECALVFIHMKTIARAIKMEELESELARLQDQAEEKASTAPKNAQEPKTSSAVSTVQSWFRLVTPHLDIKEGRLDESIFAANVADVALGNGREIYNNPVVFFSKTYYTLGLKNVAKTVLAGLNGNVDAENRVISLQTGFGGGKTHTLISLYHVCKMGKRAAQSASTEELLSFTGMPEFDTANIAVFTNTTNDAANGRITEDGILIQTIWGELAYQLGGKEAYEIIRKNDEQLIAPAGLFKQVLEQCKPALILIDELADYCVKASARRAGSSSLADQTISFMQELTEAVAGTNHCVTVITLPASPQEVGNTPEAQSILSSLQKRVSRVGADTQPVADDEIYEVIRRRLFEDTGDLEALEAAATKYMDLYHQYSMELPANANRTEYKKKILKSYPFHPELIDVFRVRWASHHDFQRTRGVLRLLAAIVSDLWKRRTSLTGPNLLIHPGMVNFANLDALSGQLKKLYGNGYDSVISADVAGSSSNALKIDSRKSEYGQWDLTQSLASVILMNSFGSDGANKGVSVPELKLNLLQPEGFNHNNINGALDELESNAYYLYYTQSSVSGKRYWFNTKPNINILINQAKGDIKEHDVQAEIIRRIKDKTNNISIFNVLVDPAGDIPEQMRPTLIVLGPNHMANPSHVNGHTKPFIEQIATKKGNSERIYRNTLLFMLCSEHGVGKLNSDIREYLACQKISREYNTQMEREQRDELKRRQDDANKQSESSVVAAYSILVKHSVKNGIDTLIIKQFKDNFDNQLNNVVIELLQEEEWLLKDSIGLTTLRNNNLLPAVGQPLKAKDVYEAFLRFDDKPMIAGPSTVSISLLRYCTNGEFSIATGEAEPFNKYYFKENVPLFDVTDATYWLVDKTTIPQPAAPAPSSPGNGVNVPSGTSTVAGAGGQPDVQSPSGPYTGPQKNVKSVTISGKVAMEHYTQLFSSFIMPLAQNNIEIEIRIKGKSTTAKPLTENSQEYKIVKESAKQLGLNFEEE